MSQLGDFKKFREEKGAESGTNVKSSNLQICKSEIIIRAKHKLTKQHDGTISYFPFFAFQKLF